MLTTKRYDYVAYEKIGYHPLVNNHRNLNMAKVAHYSEDILVNGLLEPVVVWERNHEEYFLVGGFHRMAAIGTIRQNNPGYFDRVDVRVVTGDPDEIRALNLKLNADRIDTKITDYFDTVIHLNNANWDKEKIAQFFDRSISWIDEILRYVPMMDGRVRKMLEEGTMSWNRARAICRAVREAAPGQEQAVLEQQLAGAPRPGNGQAKAAPKPLSFRSAKKRLSTRIQKQPETTYIINGDDLFSLLVVLEGKRFDGVDLDRVRNSFPGLLD
jgi:ParB family transcriptional regulator, chromosome partitioning protein